MLREKNCKLLYCFQITGNCICRWVSFTQTCLGQSPVALVHLGGPKWKGLHRKAGRQAKAAMLTLQALFYQGHYQKVLPILGHGITPAPPPVSPSRKHLQRLDRKLG